MAGRILSRRIQDLMRERGWTKEMLAENSDLPVETIKNIIYEKTLDPKISTVLQIADAFNISINCLLGKCPHTPAEKVILRNYRECGQHGKSVIELIAKYEAGAIKNQRNSLDKHMIPCLVSKGDIRKGIIYENCETTEIETTVREAYVAIEMTSNDLSPKFCKGDFILFENRFPNDGEYAAFFREGRAYIRKFIEEEKQYRLKCLHSYGEDIVVKRMDEIDYIGTCIGAVRI